MEIELDFYCSNTLHLCSLFEKNDALVSLSVEIRSQVDNFQHLPGCYYQSGSLTCPPSTLERLLVDPPSPCSVDVRFIPIVEEGVSPPPVCFFKPTPITLGVSTACASLYLMAK